MSRPEPIDPPDAGPPSPGPRAVDDGPSASVPPEAGPPEVDWGAVLRGCPCRTCVEARRAVYASDPAPPRPEAGGAEEEPASALGSSPDPAPSEPASPAPAPPQPASAQPASPAPAPPPADRGPGALRPPEFVDPWSDTPGADAAPPGSEATPRPPPAGAGPAHGAPGRAREGAGTGPRGPAEASGTDGPDALEARLERTLGALLDARLAPLEARVDALLDAARKERGPIGHAARALSRFADEVEAIVSHVADPDRRR